MSASLCVRVPVVRNGSERIEAAPKKAATSLRDLTKSAPATAKTREASMATTKDRPTLEPDDPRHGSYAGVIAHWRAGTPTCGPCEIAQRRASKTAKLRRDRGIANRIPLGKAAWDVLDGCTRTQMHHATGLNRNMLSRIHKGGPERIVLRSTRDRILASRVQFTPIGIQRRLQGLAVIGYPSEFIAGKVGTHPSTLNALRRGPVTFVRHEYAKKIIDFYDGAHMKPLNVPVSSAAVRTHARTNGWVSPMAWDDIDYDKAPANEDAELQEDPAVDEVRVQRVLDGKPQDCTVAERHEVIDRWEGSLAELQRLTGWNIHREIKRKAA